VKTFGYDSIGNLLLKPDVGNYAYPAPGLPRPHPVLSISGDTVSAAFTYDANANQTGATGLRRAPLQPRVSLGSVSSMDAIARPLPPTELQVLTVGASGEEAMREARDFASDCVARFARSPRWTDERKILLDFGACWGRIARCFLPQFAPDHIIGADNCAPLLAYFSEAFPESRAIACRDHPPLDLPDRSCDFIVAYSMFSHLSERLCRAW
jgi:hypothetical protein